MTRLAALAVSALLAVPAAALAGTAQPVGSAPDCNFDGASTYERFGDIHVFEKNSKLFGCATDVGRAYKLTAPSKGVKVFGSGDWVAYAAGGSVRALNLSTGRNHRAADSATAVVVNVDGTLAWIARGRLKAKSKAGATRTIASGADARFLTLELEGCAVTWRVNGEQRSSSIFCANP